MTGQMLERSAFVDSNHSNHRSEEAIQNHLRLAKQWEDTVDRVRRIPEFENFLRRIPFSQLRQVASEEGPVVVINLSQYRCDALIVAHDGPVQLVRLPSLHLTDVRSRASTFRNAAISWHQCAITDKEFEQQHLYPILRYLWTTVVHPVVDTLGYMNPQLHAKPRIWWCPTGPLTFLPLHAAGPYDKNGPDIMQRIIFSYVTTLAALARARSRPSPAKTKMLSIGVTQTPYAPQMRTLPKIGAEIDVIRTVTLTHQLQGRQLRDEAATVDDVTSLLRDFNFIHFACHGLQIQDRPMDSVLYLGNDSLSLARIASLRLGDAEFAFLSACHTAGGSQVLPDEAMHIAAGMQVAGYRTVVGTMWSMPDWVGPEIAPEFYGRLFRGPGDDDPSISSCRSSSRVPGALREALLALRARKDRKFPAAVWANFISIGV